MIPASKFGAAEEAQEALVLTDEEKKIEEEIFVCIFKASFKDLWMKVLLQFESFLNEHTML